MSPDSSCGVFVLKLEDGKFFVGSSANSDYHLCLLALLRDSGPQLRRLSGAALVASLQRLIETTYPKSSGADPERGVPTLTLSTIHKAKGKEWPLVFLLQPASLFGLREALEGRTRTVDDDDEAEERNCTYVAVTRSTKELIVLKHIAKEGDAPLDFAPLLDGCAKPGDPGAAEGANNVRRRLFEDTDADGLAPQAKHSKRG